VVVLGRTGRNFAAGLGGGLAYVIDVDGGFLQRCDLEVGDLEALGGGEEGEFIKDILVRPLLPTKNGREQQVLDSWTEYREKLVKIMPLDYRRVLGIKKDRAAKAYVMVQHG